MFLVLCSAPLVCETWTSVEPVTGATWRNMTACFGADDRCTKYVLTCPPGYRIALGRLWYGRKLGTTHCLFGISDCKSVAAHECCHYDPNDDFLEFTDANR